MCLGAERNSVTTTHMSALRDVQKLALTRRLRLRGYFLDFDRLNHKRITLSQFDRPGRRALPLTVAQVDEPKAL